MVLPRPDEMPRLAAAMQEAGRDMGELEMVGGIPGRFEDATSVADLDQALARVPRQLARGFTSFIIKPSQFIDDPRQLGPLCREVVARVVALAG